MEIGIEGLRALLQKPWPLLVQNLRRHRILHLSDPFVYTKCQTISLFKTIKRATHKERERERERERGIPEPWEKRVVARVGFDVWDQGGEDCVVVVVGFGKRGGEPVNRRVRYLKKSKRFYLAKKKKRKKSTTFKCKTDF